MRHQAQASEACCEPVGGKTDELWAGRGLRCSVAGLLTFFFCFNAAHENEFLEIWRIWVGLGSRGPHNVRTVAGEHTDRRCVLGGDES